DPQAIDAAFKDRLAAYAKTYRRPLVRSFPESLLDVWTLGWAKLAANAGLPPEIDSPYMPLDLVEEEHVGYGIECYHLDWPQLGRVFGSGDQAFVDFVLKRSGNALFEGTQARGLRCEFALRDLILGQTGRDMAARGPDPEIDPIAVEADTALAM